MKKCVSIIIPIYNEEDCIAPLGNALKDLTDWIEQDKKYSAEVILVDDGSYDNTWANLMDLATNNPQIRLISLSRNFGQQIALTCGYRMATGDAVVCMDADLQDPPEVVMLLIAEWEKGADIAYAIREAREAESFLKKATAFFFYRLYKAISSSRAPMDAGDFRLMSRRAVDAFNQFNETHRYIRGMVGCLGFKTALVKYHRKHRVSGYTKWSLVKMVIFAMDGIISSSTIPLRLIYVCGLVGAAPFLAYLLFSFIAHYIFGWHFDRGWFSLILCTVGFGMLNLMCLGVVGEYLGRLYEQAKNRPLYLIQEIFQATGKGGREPNP